MPENLLNTPATKAQNTAYAADRTDPMGKPYSKEQIAGNAKAVGRTRLFHKKHGKNVFDGCALPF
jgi:hypothetical protein